MNPFPSKRQLVGRLGAFAGAAVLAYGVYRILKNPNDSADIDLTPADHPPEPHPYYEPHPHRESEALVGNSQTPEHRPHGGNMPGERNQIGGRTSGKRARY